MNKRLNISVTYVHSQRGPIAVTPELVPLVSSLEYTFSGGWAKNPINVSLGANNVSLEHPTESMIVGLEGCSIASRAVK